MAETAARIGNLHTSTSRGGASEASVATLTDYVDGARDIYMRQALGLIAHHACANIAESAIFKIDFYRERKLWKKRISCSGVDSNLGLMHCRPLLLPPSRALASLDCKFGSYTVVSVDYSEKPYSHHGYLEKANRLRHYKVYLLYSFS